MYLLDRHIDKNNKKILKFLLVGGLLYVLPIILANRYYNDDLARSLYAATGWLGDGRPLAELTMLILSGGGAIADISPLPLVLGILMLALTLTIYTGNELSAYEDTMAVRMALLLVLVQPFSMAAISYKYDCVFMFMAICIPFLAFSVKEELPQYVCFIVSTVAGILTMSLYQAAFGMFLILELIHFYLRMLGEERIVRGYLKKESFRILGMITGALIYVIFIAGHFVDTTGWRSEAAEISLKFKWETVIHISQNIRRGCAYQYNILKQTSGCYKGSLLLLWLLAIISEIIWWWKGERNLKRALLMFISIMLPFVAVVCVYFPMTVLISFDTKYRVFLCFGGVLLLVSLMAMKEFHNRCRILMLIMLACLLFQYSCVYAYGNALKCQKTYEEYTVQQIAHDLERINAEKEYKEVSFLGNPPKARQLQKVCEKYPFFNEIVPVYVSNDTWIGGAWVYHYLQYDLEICEIEEPDIEVVQSEKAETENSLYKCYTNDSKIIICWQ